MNKKSIKGITPLNMEQHSFDGYNVRRQKNGWKFQTYVTAAQQAYPGKTEKVRFKKALDDAQYKLGKLGEILDNPRFWKDNGEGLELNRNQRRILENEEGFRITRMKS